MPLTVAGNLVDQLPLLTSEAELRVALKGIAEAFKLPWFAVIDHVDQSELGTGDLGIYAYPEIITDRLRIYSNFRHDPVIRGCRHSEGPFIWSHMGRFMTFNAADKAALAFGRQAGLAEGITVPIFHGRRRAASLTFAGPDEGTNLDRYLAAVQMVAPFVLQCARRIAGHQQVLAPPPRLTPRQLDCAILAGRGLQNKQIAYDLGLSVDHVAEQISLAMRRFGVRSRTALGVAAVAAGEIEFAELDPLPPNIWAMSEP